MIKRTQVGFMYSIAGASISEGLSGVFEGDYIIATLGVLAGFGVVIVSNVEHTKLIKAVELENYFKGRSAVLRQIGEKLDGRE